MQHQFTQGSSTLCNECRIWNQLLLNFNQSCANIHNLNSLPCKAKMKPTKAPICRPQALQSWTGSSWGGMQDFTRRILCDPLWQTIFWDGSVKRENGTWSTYRKSKKQRYGISFPSKNFCRPLHPKGQFNCKPKQLYTSCCKPQTCKMQHMTAGRLVFHCALFYCACTSLTQHAYWERLSMGCVLHTCQIAFACIMLVNESVWRWTANPQFPQIKFIPIRLYHAGHTNSCAWAVP